MQPLPVLAPGPADLLGCGRHRGSPPTIHAWLRLPAPPSHIGKSPSPPSCLSLQKQIDVLISTSFPFKKDLNLCLDLSFFVNYSFSLPDLKLIQFPSLFSLTLPMFLLFSLPFLDWFPNCCCFFYFTPSSFPSTHSSSFVYLNLHEHWFWVVGCSLGAALSTAPVIEGTLYVASKQEQTIHRSSRWFSDGRVLYPCCHKKGLLKLVMSMGFLEQLYTIFWPRTGVNRC